MRCRAVLKRTFEKKDECAYCFFALGSDCELRLFAAQRAAAEAAGVAVATEIARVEVRYSRYRADSELSRISAVAKVGDSIEVDDDTAGLID
jgi:FAD:protein FMN transferase